MLGSHIRALLGVEFHFRYTQTNKQTALLKHLDDVDICGKKLPQSKIPNKWKIWWASVPMMPHGEERMLGPSAAVAA